MSTVTTSPSLPTKSAKTPIETSLPRKLEKSFVETTPSTKSEKLSTETKTSAGVPTDVPTEVSTETTTEELSAEKKTEEVRKAPVCYYYNRSGCRDGSNCPFLHIKDKSAGVSKKCKKRGCTNKARPGYEICPPCYHGVAPPTTPEKKEVKEVKEEKEEKGRLVAESKINAVGSTEEQGRLVAESKAHVVGSTEKKIEAQIPQESKEEKKEEKIVSELKQTEKSEKQKKEGVVAGQGPCPRTLQWGDVEDDEPSPRSEEKTRSEEKSKDEDGYTMVRNGKSRKTPKRSPKPATVISCCNRGNPVYLRLEYCESCVHGYERNCATSGRSVPSERYVKLHKCRGRGCTIPTPMEYCTRCAPL